MGIRSSRFLLLRGHGPPLRGTIKVENGPRFSGQQAPPQANRANYQGLVPPIPPPPPPSQPLALHLVSVQKFHRKSAMSVAVLSLYHFANWAATPQPEDVISLVLSEEPPLQRWECYTCHYGVTETVELQKLHPPQKSDRHSESTQDELQCCLDLHIARCNNSLTSRVPSKHCWRFAAQGRRCLPCAANRLIMFWS